MGAEMFGYVDAAARVSDREGWQFQLSRALIIGEPIMPLLKFQQVYAL